MTSPKSGIKIVKASGDVENFDPNIITKECIDAGIEFFTAAEVALEVSKRIYDGISTKEIQDSALKILYEKHPEAAERYKRFQSMHVRTSRNTIEPFDRKKIAASLIMETRLPKELAETIAKESETELRRLKLDFISAPLIREVVNVKLLEHGFEEARADYTRLGMPVYDAAQLIELGSKEDADLRNPERLHARMADNVFVEYTLLKVLPLHLADAHMRGEIHIHDLNYFVTRPRSARHDLRWFLKNGIRAGAGKKAGTLGPAKSAEMAVLYAAKALAIAQTNFSGEQTFDFFNVYLAPYLQGRDYEGIKQVSQMYIYETQIPTSGVLEICLDYGCPEILKDVPAILPGGIVKKRVTYSDFEEESKNFSRAVTELYLQGDYLGRPFFLPRVYYNMRKGNKEGYEEFMTATHKLALKFGTPYFLNLRSKYEKELMEEAGCLQIVTLNLPRIVYEAEGNEDKFYEILDNRLNMAREVVMIKRELIEHRMKQGFLPFLSQVAEGWGHYLDKATHSISYVGVNEAAKAYTGKEMHESDFAWSFGLEIVKYIHDTAKKWTEDSGLRWTVTQTPTESTSYRLAKLDYGQFSDKAAVLGYPSTGLHYTNSALIRADADVPLERKLELEGAFHPLTSGMRADILIDKKHAKVAELLDLSRKVAKSSIRCWTYKIKG